jgi:secreted trypsin-like serine protease
VLKKIDTGTAGVYSLTPKLVNGGANATLKQFPWQVYLIADGFRVCGGSIISNKWILTAAHCVDG